MILFDHYDKMGDEFGDSKNCAVISACVLTDKSYDECFYAFLEAGRKRNVGTRINIETKAFKTLGYDLIFFSKAEILDNINYTYGKDYKYVVTRHVNQYKEVFENYGDLLVQVAGHVLAIKDCVVEDWSRKRSLRFCNVYKVRKIK